MKHRKAIVLDIGHGLAAICVVAAIPAICAQQAAPLTTPMLSITKIDKKEVRKGEVVEVGREVRVEGSTTDPNVRTCIAVHPTLTDTWWVQSLPSPADPIGRRAWRLNGTILCGTNKLIPGEQRQEGRGEEFEVVMLAESRPSICQPGRQFKTGEFPSVPRSPIVTVRRTRD